MHYGWLVRTPAASQHSSVLQESSQSEAQELDVTNSGGGTPSLHADQQDPASCIHSSTHSRSSLPQHGASFVLCCPQSIVSPSVRVSCWSPTLPQVATQVGMVTATPPLFPGSTLPMRTSNCTCITPFPPLGWGELNLDGTLWTWPISGDPSLGQHPGLVRDSPSLWPASPSGACLPKCFPCPGQLALGSMDWSSSYLLVLYLFQYLLVASIVPYALVRE